MCTSDNCSMSTGPREARGRTGAQSFSEVTSFREVYGKMKILTTENVRCNTWDVHFPTYILSITTNHHQQILKKRPKTPQHDTYTTYPHSKNIPGHPLCNDGVPSDSNFFFKGQNHQGWVGVGLCRKEGTALRVTTRSCAGQGTVGGMWRLRAGVR